MGAELDINCEKGALEADTVGELAGERQEFCKADGLGGPCGTDG